MKKIYIVETEMDCVEFNTYHEAEAYCYNNKISCENIYEEIL